MVPSLPSSQIVPVPPLHSSSHVSYSSPSPASLCCSSPTQVCVEAVRSAVLSELADEALELDCDHATPTLKEIMCSTPPTPNYVRFHDTYLRK